LSSFVAYSCTHVPVIHRKSEEKLIKYLQDFKPDTVVMLGDLMDASPASRWPNEDEWDITYEYEVAAEHLRHVRLESGASKLVWLLGNHDDNILAQCRIPKRLRRQVDWRSTGNPLSEEVKHWKMFDYSHEQAFHMGPVTFQHGAEHGTDSGLRLAQLYAPENGLLVYGHTHRPTNVTWPDIRNGIPLRKAYANAGCMADWTQMNYVKRKNKAPWGHALVAGEANDKRRERSFATKQWEAETVYLD